MIAEKENKSNLNGLCDLLFGFVDLLSLMLIFLPLYPKPVDGYIYSVSLIEYVDNEIWIRMTYWGLFITLTIIGIVNILMVKFKFEKGKKVNCKIMDKRYILSFLSWAYFLCDKTG